MNLCTPTHGVKSGDMTPAPVGAPPMACNLVQGLGAEPGGLGENASPVFLEIGFLNWGANLKAKLEIWLQKNNVIENAVILTGPAQEVAEKGGGSDTAATAHSWCCCCHQLILGTVGHRDFGVILSGWASQWTIPLYVNRYYRHTYNFFHIWLGGGLGPLGPPPWLRHCGSSNR